jgi:hypothetical protein
MSAPKQEEWLQKELDQLIRTFRRERERHKRLAVLLKSLTVTMAGAVTILLGWKVSTGAPPPLLANIALVLGALITVVSAYEAFFDPRALWLRETIAFARLKDLQRAFAYAVAGAGEKGVGEAALAEFNARMEAILHDSLQTWLRLRGVEESAPRSATA